MDVPYGKIHHKNVTNIQIIGISDRRLEYKIVVDSFYETVWAVHEPLVIFMYSINRIYIGHINKRCCK